MSMVPCLTWVRREKAKSKPDRIQLDKDELKRLIEATEKRLNEDEDEDDEEDVADESDEMAEDVTDTAGAKSNKKGDKSQVKQESTKKRKTFESVEDEYKMSNYDDEDDVANPLAGIGNLTIYADNEEDPYVTLKDEDESDDEDTEIKPTDNLVVYGKVDNEICTLEVHVYNELLGNYYCHHELLLPTFPLVVEWMDYDVGEETPGNFVAVGGMEPNIDIWDLDVIDSLEPVCSLGSRKVKGKKKKGSVDGHTDAVLDLSWNSTVRTALASASADFSIGLWDLSEGKMITSIKQHKEKVQCVKWHPLEPQTLLSGSFDHTAKVYDCRSPHNTNKTWKLGGEIEVVMWDRFSPMNFFASTETGTVFYMDSRQNKPLYQIAAHSDAVTGLAQSCSVAGVLLTSSGDQTLKIWDVLDNKPSLVLSRYLNMGQLHCLSNSPDSSCVFAVGGDRETMVWDIRESADVRKHFRSRLDGVDEKAADDESVDITADNNSPGDGDELMDDDDDDDDFDDKKQKTKTTPVSQKTKKKKKKNKKKQS